nr:reverse transcriptase domain-containing protein [Tanacetum cinerariifolium]
MDLANVGDTSQQHRGKMILMEPEITYISELSTTYYDNTIKAIVYRKWTSKTTKTRTPTKFCCILIDKEHIDYIGRIRAIGRIEKKGDAMSSRKTLRVIDIENLSGNVIGCTLWNEMATNFDERAYNLMEKPIIIDVSSCYINHYHGPMLEIVHAQYEDMEREKIESDSPQKLLSTTSAHNNVDVSRPPSFVPRNNLWSNNTIPGYLYEILSKDTETPVESPILVPLSSSEGSSSPFRSTTPDYLFDESIFVELDNSLWIISRPLGSKPLPEDSNDNYAEENRVTFATGTLTDDALSWWNAYAQPIRIEQANEISWTELKRLLTNKYCPRTEVKKMEDEFYNLVVKGDDLKTYVRRFQELAILCPNMVPNTKKIMEAFIGGLPQSIEGNVTALKPQTLEEATNISHRLIDQILMHKSMQETNDHKRKFDDMRNTTINNNNYPNNHENNNYPNTRNNNNHSNNRIDNNNNQDNRNNNNRNNDHHQQQNRRQETFKVNGNHGYNGPSLGNVHCITQDHALSGVRIATK